MNQDNRGRKHICHECACKYYDLGKKEAPCPKCGAKPPPPPKATRSGPAGRGVRFRR